MEKQQGWIRSSLLKNVSPNCVNWIARLSTEIGNSGKIPKLWLESKVIAILKPNKDASDLNNYRSISLLYTMYKLLLLARSQPIVEKSYRRNKLGSDKIETVAIKFWRFQRKWKKASSKKQNRVQIMTQSRLEVSFLKWLKSLDVELLYCN